MDFAFGLLFFALITALCSALHGTDTPERKVTNKGYVIGVHVLLSLIASIYAPIAVGLYWGFFRRSKQAIAELDYLGKDVERLKTEGNLAKVKAAYPPVIGSIMAKIMDHVQNHPWYFLADKPSRVQQEVYGSFALGLILFPLAYAFGVIVGAL